MYILRKYTPNYNILVFLFDDCLQFAILLGLLPDICHVYLPISPS